MIKSELVQRIAEHNPHLYQRDVENIVNAILDEIVAALARGDRVELRGFGAFSVKHRPARAGRNPRTGAHVPVDQKSVPFFKTGKEMRERLNRDDGAPRPARKRVHGVVSTGSRCCESMRSADASDPTREKVMRKFLTALIVIPLGLIFIVFAVANRHLVTVSFDPFNSERPIGCGDAAAVRRHHRGGDPGGRWRAAWRPGSASATGAARRASTRPMRAQARARIGRSAGPRRPRGRAAAASGPSRAAFTGPPGETSRARRCRTRPAPSPDSGRSAA